MTTYDTSWMGETDEKLKSDKPFTAGITTNRALIADEQSRLGAREAFGMPKATAQSVTGATMGTAGTSSQATLSERLKAIYGGGGSTAGQQQLQANADAAKRAQMAAAFGGPGGAARSMRSVGNQASLTSATTAQQSAVLGAQEQQAALNQYAALSGAMRGADLAEANEQNKINMANAGFANQSAMANQQTALNWQQMNDAQKRALLGMNVDLSQNEWDNKLGYYGALRGREMDWLNQRKQQDAQNNARAAQGVMSAMTVGMAGMKGG